MLFVTIRKRDYQVTICLDIYDVKRPQDHNEHGEKSENFIFTLIFNFNFKILVPIVTEISVGGP